MFEGVIGYIIGGAVIGILARFLKPGADPMGWIFTILLGIAGGILVGVHAYLLGLGSVVLSLLGWGLTARLATAR